MATENALTLALMRHLGQAPGNRAVSGTGVRLALAMLLAGARGKSAKALADLLGIGTALEAMVAAVAELEEDLEAAAGSTTLTLAGRVWLDDSLTPAADVADAVARAFGDGPGRAPFATDTEAARDAVNAWTREATRGEVPEILGPRSLSSEDRLAIVTALYFAGRWAEPFDPEATRPAVFHLEDGTDCEVETMRHPFDAVPLGRFEGARIATLAYADSALALDLVLPEPGIALSDVEARLEAKVLADAVAGAKPEPVFVALPRLTVDWQGSLLDALTNLGVGPVLDASRADLTGFGPKLFVGKVIHQAKVMLDESGTVAAAATAVVVPAGGPPTRTIFACDRPFLGFVRDRVSGRILFGFRVADPRG